MPEPKTPFAACPTRPDGQESLFTHRIPESTCSERQERGYHRCYGCVRNADPARLQPVPPAPDIEPVLILDSHPRRVPAAQLGETAAKAV